MQPAEKKSEVVYRRRNLPAALPSAEAATADLAKRAFVRAITPLIIGFLILLGLISWLGWRSANEMEQVGENARRSEERRVGKECRPRGGTRQSTRTQTTALHV